MGKRDMSVERARTIFITLGKVKGASRDVVTTMTRTRGLFAFAIFEINGATAPVEIPDRSSAAMA
jgi:hypothetical protein